MRIGLSTPIVVQIPGVASAWESGGTIDDLARIASVADELGVEYLTCSEHVAVPAAEAERRGTAYWDPLATFGFLAARTSRIRLATSVLVLGYHHPLEIAKRYGTVDRVSGGRLILGVGIGSLTEEFDLLGAVWENRAARADDAIRALRASMSTATPAFSGTYFTYRDMTVEPHALQPRVPIWVGGRSVQSLHRAVRLADGWMPFGLKPPAIRQMVAQVKPPDGFQVVLATGRAVDPSGDPPGTRRHLETLRDVGATAITCTVSARSASHFCDQLARLREIADTIEQEES